MTAERLEQSGSPPVKPIVRRDEKDVWQPHVVGDDKWIISSEILITAYDMVGGWSFLPLPIEFSNGDD